MTLRMRKQIATWEKTHECPDDDQGIQQWKLDRQHELNKMWAHETEDAYLQGILKAHKERGYKDTIGVDPKERNYWVTVNPKEDIPLETFVKETAKFVKQKHIDKAEYVFEQRGATTEEEGKGKHLHMLVKGNSNPADFIKRCKAKFEKFVGTEKHIHITQCPTEFHNDKREYMKGHKTGEGKAEKVAHDAPWREKNNLQQYYIHTNAWCQEERSTPTEQPPSQETPLQGSSAQGST